MMKLKKKMLNFKYSNTFKSMNKFTLLLETSELNEYSNIIMSAQNSKNQSMIST